MCRHCSSSPVLTSRLIVSKWLWQFSIIDQNETDRTYPNKHWPRFGIIWWWWWFDFWLNIMAVDIIIVIRNTLIWSHLSWATIRGWGSQIKMNIKVQRISSLLHLLSKPDRVADSFVSHLDGFRHRWDMNLVILANHVHEYMSTLMDDSEVWVNKFLIQFSWRFPPVLHHCLINAESRLYWGTVKSSFPLSCSSVDQTMMSLRQN